MKKQILFTFILFSCALVVLALYFYSPNGSSGTVQGSIPVQNTLINTSAWLVQTTDSDEGVMRSPLRLRFFKGLPFILNKISLISAVLIIIMAIFISKFIKPHDKKIEFICDSDGMK